MTMSDSDIKSEEDFLTEFHGTGFRVTIDASGRSLRFTYRGLTVSRYQFASDWTMAVGQMLQKFVEHDVALDGSFEKAIEAFNAQTQGMASSSQLHGSGG